MTVDNEIKIATTVNCPPSTVKTVKISLSIVNYQPSTINRSIDSQLATADRGRLRQIRNEN
ncbi:MAG: hypothetical protein ACRC62_35235 [Microcoleus sp.]